MTISPSIPQNTLSLEDNLKLGAQHLDQLVDDQGHTHFDVFLTNPPEAVTDWPDFVDLPSRYWEASAMVAPIAKVNSTERLRKWLFHHFEADGLAYRPESPISGHIAELFDQSRLLYALTSWAMHAPEDTEVRQHLIGLMEGLIRLSTREKDIAYINQIGTYFGGTLIRPALHAGLLLNRPEWVDFAGGLARGLIDHSDLVGPDGSVLGHLHGTLSALAGSLAYAIVTGDQHLLDRARAGFDYAHSISTNFGFVPEMAQRDDDLIASETCTIMDYLDTALLLARHVDPIYWDVVEKTTRNHLWESQIRDGSWIGNAGGMDQEGIIRSRLNERIIGSFAGWSAPHCMLAYLEQFWEGWVHTPEMYSRFIHKDRAMQNCCAGAGIRANYQVWSNIITQKGKQISVNLSIDRASPDLRVTSFIPFEGRVLIDVSHGCDLRWRLPAHCSSNHLQVTIQNQNVSSLAIEDGFLKLGYLPSGTSVEVKFPLPEREETIVMGNTGFQQYRFDLSWRGDTLLSIHPDPQNSLSGYSRVMKARVRTVYGEAGFGPLYQRQGWVSGLPVARVQLANASPKIDWYTLNS
jgi:hypothetical protein